MEIIKIIVKEIIISPKHLNSNIESYIIEKIKEKYLNICTEEGMIIDIIKILEFKNTISKDSKTIIFEVSFQVKILEIKKGIKVSFKPSLIIEKGIFGKMEKNDHENYDNITFLIPNSKLEKKEENLSNWVFINDTFKKGKKNINKNTVVNAVISDIRFDSEKKDENDKVIGSFNCICSFY